MEEDQFESFPVTNETDKAILMHRDVHFGGKFDFMIDYYLKNGKGIHPDFELTRIKELQIIEEGMKQNLAGLMLSGPDAERVAEAKEAYRKLKTLYEKESEAHRLPKLIADLILSEEEYPEAEIQAVIAEKAAMVPLLMDLLKSEDFHDSLFPGYGFAPALATKCLGLIGDKRAIISLFESIGNEDFFNEDLALEALKKIGEPAKAFLLKVMHTRPITADNESAALALVQFKDDPEVGKACLEALKGLDLKKEFALATYLILACEDLKNENQQQELIALGKLPTTPGMLRRDIETLSRPWNKK